MVAAVAASTTPRPIRRPGTDLIIVGSMPIVVAYTAAVSTRGKVIVWLVVLVPLAAIALAALNAPRGEEKDYHFPRVLIEATVEADGSVTLDERRTFDFRGRFSFARYTVDWPIELIEGFEVSEEGRPIPTFPIGTADGISATWTVEAVDELRTFRIRYRALCAVDVYEDAAHLLWQFVGTGWEKETTVGRVRVRLPEAAQGRVPRSPTCPATVGGELRTRPLVEGQVRAWGHGPLAGEVRILDPHTVELRVRDLRPFTFVEGSILFPNRVVPFAPIEGGPSFGRILAEERRLAAEADTLRRQHAVESGVVAALMVLVPLFCAGMVLLARRRDRVPNVPRVLSEPPEDIHPVDLAMLWSAYRRRLQAKNAYRAQMLHLARTGVIDVQAVGRVTDPEDFRLSLRERPDGIDGEFVEFLFTGDGKRPVSMKSVRNAGTRATNLTDWWKKAGKRTKRLVTTVVKGRSRPERAAMTLVALGAAVYGYWRSAGFSEGGAFFDGLVGPWAFWLVVIAVASRVVAGKFMPVRLPTELRERVARWAAFRRFLKRFSTFDDAPALAVIVWERYLVYAVALDVADRVEKQVREILPPEDIPEPWPGAPRGLAGFTAYHHWSTTSRAYVAPAAASSVGWSSGWGGASSGGGFGGGFSGGGGGGGGGTGGGAG
jgi:uncharacterized membrane protein